VERGPNGRRQTCVEATTSLGHPVLAGPQTPARLLYVGMTRARDYLVFATRPPAPSAWIDILTRAEGTPVLTLPATDGETQVNIDGESLTMVVQSPGPPLAAGAQGEAPQVAWFAPLSLSGEQPKYPPARLSPSAASQDSNDNGTPVTGKGRCKIPDRCEGAADSQHRLFACLHGYECTRGIRHHYLCSLSCIFLPVEAPSEFLSKVLIIPR